MYLDELQRDLGGGDPGELVTEDDKLRALGFHIE
jgi:hypothetical protein